MAGGRGTQDNIGQRGEAIFKSHIMAPIQARPPGVRPDGYLFFPVFLGDTFPSIDFLVELQVMGVTITPYFFVQVKTTMTGYTKRDRRLKIRAPADKIQGLTAYPAPTYVVGIDLIPRPEISYLVSANGENRTSLSSLSTAYPLGDENTRLQLWQEVRAYWQMPKSPKLTSAFVDTNWK